MDYDQFLQYRERHNASWDRIRHENASSVRSEPADPTAYGLLNNNNNHNAEYQYHNFHDQSLVIPNNYAPQPQILDYAQLPNTQIVQVRTENPQICEQVFEEEVEEEEESEVEEEEEEEEENANEVDHPDVYCIECDSKLDEPTTHDVTACSRVNLNRFECSTCRKSFNFEKNLKLHKTIEHLKAIDFVRGSRCQFCPNDSPRTSFGRFTAYIGHLKIHLKPDFLICEQCSSEFENERDLDRHTRRDHSDDLYELIYCPKCQKVITFEEANSHILLHSALKAVKDRKSKNAQKLVENKSKKRKVKERVRKFQCTECPKSFVRPAELARHSAVHVRAKSSTSTCPPKWKCAICSKEYSHEAGLLEHKRVAHGTARKIVCRVCGLIFTKKSNHDRHMSQIHPLDQDSKDRSKFECPDCPTVHHTLGALTRHKRTCHNKTAMKQQKANNLAIRHICRTCKREFREPKMLDKHQRMHVLSEHRWRDLQGGGERKCDYCEKSFVLRASLLWHQQKHFEEAAEPVEAQSNDTPPYCSICDLHFDSNLEYRQHLDEQHTVICGICQQKFSSRQVYEDHICNRKFATRNANNQVVPSNRVVICRLCRPPQRLTTYRQIKEHRLRYHLPRKTHLCWTCHKSFRTAQLLSLHAEVHDRQPVQCSHCPQVFHSRVALKQHTRLSHGGDTNYQCVVHVDRTMAMSAQSFAEYGLAADHSEEQLHRAHSVTEWMEGAQEEDHPQENHEGDHLQYQTLTNVITSSNPGANSRTTGIPVEQQPIRCEVCHHLYNNIDLLCDHWHSSDTDNDHTYAFVTCPMCELRIRGAADAANHLKSVHLFARPSLLSFMKPTDPMPSNMSNSLALAIIPAAGTKKKHQCVHCARSFTRKNDLARHEKIHTGEKEFECPSCHSSFREKSTLKSHLLTHSNNPPQFQCTVCQKAFYEKKTLVVHMRIHTGELPFKCRYCDLHFRTTAMARTHEKKCAYGGPLLPDPTLPSTSSFQPQFVAPEAELNRTITQISSMPAQQLQLSRNTAFNVVNSVGLGSGDIRCYVITKPINTVEYVVIVQKSKPAASSVRCSVDTVSEIKSDQLRESATLSIVLHNEMRLNLNTVKMLQMLHSFRSEDTFKTRVMVAQFGDENERDLFSIIAHNKTSGSSFLRRCDICEVDLLTKRASDAHFYSEDHETAQLMYPSTTQQSLMATVRHQGGANILPDTAQSGEFSCKLCGSLHMDMDSLLEHIRKEHDDPVIRPRPVAHTAPIN